jgi:hypothetical protein
VFRLCPGCGRRCTCTSAATKGSSCQPTGNTCCVLLRPAVLGAFAWVCCQELPHCAGDPKQPLPLCQPQELYQHTWHLRAAAAAGGATSGQTRPYLWCSCCCPPVVAKCRALSQTRLDQKQLGCIPATSAATCGAASAVDPEGVTYSLLLLHPCAALWQHPGLSSWGLGDCTHAVFEWQHHWSALKTLVVSFWLFGRLVVWSFGGLVV